MGTFEEPKGGPLDIGEEYWEITILGGERYWDTGENIHPWCWPSVNIALNVQIFLGCPGHFIREVIHKKNESMDFV